MRAALAPIRSAFHRCRGISFKSAAELRRACRSNTWTGPTAGEAPGYVQANLVILPGKYAEQFRDFCVKNAAPCPLLEHTGPGSFEPKHLAPGADLRTDLPKYHVWREGIMVEERQEVLGLCEDDMHGFLLGCSFTWEDLLAEAYLTPRHVEEGRNVPMFDSSIELRSAGPFQGHMVVSMRPYRKEDAEKVCAITGEFPAAHGPPVQIGQPAEIGVKDLMRPDYGEAVSFKDGEVPLFWACGVTPQNALKQAKLPLVITHAPGHMLVGDIRNDELKDWQVPGVWSARPTQVE